jgi:hypothetical protein
MRCSCLRSANLLVVSPLDVATHVSLNGDTARFHLVEAVPVVPATDDLLQRHDLLCEDTVTLLLQVSVLSILQIKLDGKTSSFCKISVQYIAIVANFTMKNIAYNLIISTLKKCSLSIYWHS